LLKQYIGNQGGKRVAVTQASDLVPVLHEIIEEEGLALRESHVHEFAHVQFACFCKRALLTRAPLDKTYIKVKTITENLINHCHHEQQNSEDEPAPGRYSYV